MIAIPVFALHPMPAIGTRSASAVTRVRVEDGRDIARTLADLGFARLFLVDPNSTTGVGPNVRAVEDILHDTHARVQVGDVSTTTDVEYLLRAGVDLVVVGARAIEEPEWLADIADLYAGSIIVATDVRDRRVVRRGWVRTLPVDILDLVEELNQLTLGGLLVTVPNDGAVAPVDLALLEDVAERSRCPVSVAGMGHSLHDLRALDHRGIAGAVIDAQRILSGDVDARALVREFGGWN
jgi:phosphoribosylformimino-5-aminoimidazole carboxamide ribonucleotide (ProFAR) isomerase